MILPVYVYARVLIYIHVNRSLVFVGDVAVNGTDQPHLDGVCIVTACAPQASVPHSYIIL